MVSLWIRGSVLFGVNEEQGRVKSFCSSSKNFCFADIVLPHQCDGVIAYPMTYRKVAVLSSG